MACRIKIKKKLEETVDTLSQEGEGKSLPLAKQVANKVNNQFNTKVVDFVISGDYIDKVITIPDPLVDAYYDAQVELEVEEDDLTKRKQGNWTTDKEGNVIPYFESRISTQIKPGVQELFTSNPELANQVYEVLGFNVLRKKYNQEIISVLWSRLSKEGIDNADDIIGTRATIDDVDFNKFWSNVTEKDLLYLKQSYQIQKKEQLDDFQKYGSEENKFIPEKGIFLSSDTSFFDNKINDINLILQQKQQALQLYSQYLDTGKQDIEGFKKFVGKGEVEKKQVEKTKENITFTSQKDLENLPEGKPC